eukprot:10991642-Alexandrium_andersonii.AAC.1
MLTHQEAPQLEAQSISGELRFGHPEPAGDGALGSGINYPAGLGHVEAHQEARRAALAQIRDGLKLFPPSRACNRPAPSCPT